MYVGDSYSSIDEGGKHDMEDDE